MAEDTTNSEEIVQSPVLDNEVPQELGNETSEKLEEEKEPEEIVVTIGDEAPTPEEEPAPNWVKELRKNFRTVQQEKVALEKKIKELTSPKEDNNLGPEPTLEDVDYDAEEYKNKLKVWIEKKNKLDEKNALEIAKQEQQAQLWQQKLSSYKDARDKLAVKDFDDAEDVVSNNFSDTQKGIVLEGTKNPALLVYALGKNPKKVKELASIKSPIEFAVAIGELASQLKVTPRKSAPHPEEGIVIGTGSLASTVDSTLDKLRADAAKTGDFTKVLEYKRQKAKKM